MLEIMRYELVSAHPDSVEHLQRARTSLVLPGAAPMPFFEWGGEVKVILGLHTRLVTGIKN